MHKKTVDTIIINGDIFTGDRSQPHYRPGAVAISDSVVVGIGHEQEILSAYDATRKIDAQGALVHPGFIETHLHSTGMAYHGAPFSPLSGAASKVNYSSMKGATDPEITAAYTAAAACSMLQRGFTLYFESGTVIETDAFAETMTKCGVRGMVTAAWGWDDLSSAMNDGHGHNETLKRRAPADARRVIDQCKHELARNKDDNAMVRGYVGLQGGSSSTDELIQEAVRVAADSNAIFWAHQAFDPDSDAEERRKFGDCGTVRMHRLGALGPSTTLAHMNMLDEQDIELILAMKPGLSWCPNNAMAYRITPPHKCWFPHLYRNGASVSLGVDTIMIHPIGIAGLMSLYLSRLVGERLNDSDPFYMQTIDAARNVGLGDKLGSLAVGKRADVVIREARDITHYSWRDDMGILLSLSSSMIPVDTVLIDGKVVMEKGRLTTMDQDEILAEAARQRDLMADRIST
ncbi:amidohydrolase family protein [Mesorhizobium sp. M1E.F.Ca.ET.041.01.1.1]|uniref:amidohydrolase family protein n=1 Tax=Mesorhizobium sp. M1E.F.Ca.ET.041.01.1.1 TaxID=2496759 RepID=UPI00167647CA|nr:amidohydrolase family protein [Mesorhizobium sp. M1E.F.Ca.ET.041.01.1.1]